MLEQSDPHGRRCEERRDLLPLDQLQHEARFGCLGQMAEASDQEGRHHDAMHLGRVVERQRCQVPIFRCVVEPHDTARVMRGEGPVRHHRAFGAPGCTGRVKQLRQVIVPNHRVRGGIACRAPARIHGGGQEVSRCGSVEGAPKGNAVPLARSQRGLPQDLLVKQRLRPGLAQDGIQFNAVQRVVDWHMDQSGPDAAEPWEQVGVRVPAKRSHPVFWAGLIR